ncbi:MAG TPA: hypothetical protein VND98_07110 [Solirubrobacterales bacterium]|nr:hypothetical protein [Solirubrobacterales bacterium]
MATVANRTLSAPYAALELRLLGGANLPAAALIEGEEKASPPRTHAGADTGG